MNTQKGFYEVSATKTNITSWEREKCRISRYLSIYQFHAIRKDIIDVDGAKVGI
jgi:hypothetical protein